ncbi:hypothetical protein [Streptomyces sp. NPDC058595]|uniref:hypothetical protein n=1 Tax=Streptomyces sp. NPDC058595 TaxID=3346550 RepID=UPI00365C0375
MPGFKVPQPKKPRPRGSSADNWNGGQYGMPQPGRIIDSPGDCKFDRCGVGADTVDESDTALTGWVRAGVYGSAEPDRIWCSGLHAAYGVALAELRLPGPEAGHG